MGLHRLRLLLAREDGELVSSAAPTRTAWQRTNKPAILEKPHASVIVPVLCRIFGHRRVGREAAFDPAIGAWRSYCKRCGTRLIRDSAGAWRTAGEVLNAKLRADAE